MFHHKGDISEEDSGNPRIEGHEGSMVDKDTGYERLIEQVIIVIFA